MMEQSVITEQDCNVLGGLFQIIINDLKGGSSTWEDFIVKASKFQTQLKATISASTAFLDAFQKVADMATTTRGGTKEIGTALTRLCLRHRSVEAKLKSFSSAVLDCLIMPLQDRVEEWKKTTFQLDKEHSKELKRLRQEFKKRQICDPVSMSSNSYRSKKHSGRLSKSSKYEGIYGTIGASLIKSNNNSLSRSLDSEMECNERLVLFEDLEKKAVRRALIEERSHFCLFVKFLRPVVEEEIGMIQEIGHIQEIMDSLSKLTSDPFDLPSASENVISGLKLTQHQTSVWNFQTPPSSPSSLGSRKSSMCSISSVNSSSSSSTYGQTGQGKHFSLTHIPSVNFSSANTNTVSSLQENIYIRKYDLQFGEQCTESNRIESSSKSGRLPDGSNNSSNENKNNNNNKNKTYDTNELQFHLEHDSGYYGPTVIHSTNPFLSCYTTESSYNQNNAYGSGSDGNAYSEGTVTPTNGEQKGIEMFESGCNEDKQSGKSSKPPPAPPIRRTSSISNPNAITMGTLKNAGISTDFENLCQNSSLYDEINVLTKSMNDINYSLKYTDFANTNSQSVLTGKSHREEGGVGVRSKETSNNGEEYGQLGNKSDYRSTKSLFESQCQANAGTNSGSRFMSEEDSSQLPLPAPPPEAFISDSGGGMGSSSESMAASQNHHYNKITNVHRDFLETLNSKLSQSPLVQHNNSRVSKRRNSNHSEESDSQLYAKHRSSSRSSSTSRTLSRKNSFEKSNIISNFRENFLDKLSQTLVQKQQNVDLAKTAASNVLQRKQSVPDLNELNATSLKHQTRATFSSSLNLSSSGQSFQVVNIQTNSTQQPIYVSRGQLRREMHDMYSSLNMRSTPYGSAPERECSLLQNGFYNKI